jgi:geranylgeranyl diphosphate synthase type II
VSSLDSEIEQRARTVDDFLVRHFELFSTADFFAPRLLVESMSYSLHTGGKRFRPVLALLVGEHFEQDMLQILPWAAAIELIHTYSLIHDDLPCMDNDDLRRGKPTNHKVYGEATALLAGDGLQTEAFQILMKYYSHDASLACQLVERLCAAAGPQGMVGGQALDLQAEKIPPSLDELKLIQKLKTGMLIRVTLEGAAIASGASKNDVLALKYFGESLGLAFQIADDLLDADQGDQSKSFVSLLGIQGTQELLHTTSLKAKEYLNKLAKPNVLLLQLIDYNINRKV